MRYILIVSIFISLFFIDQQASDRKHRAYYNQNFDYLSNCEQRKPLQKLFPIPEQKLIEEFGDQLHEIEQVLNEPQKHSIPEVLAAFRQHKKIMLELRFEGKFRRALLVPLPPVLFELLDEKDFVEVDADMLWQFLNDASESDSSVSL